MDGCGDWTLATQMMAYYKTIRTTVQQGELYRLVPPRGQQAAGGVCGAGWVAGRGVAYLHSQHYGRRSLQCALQGLDPRAKYRVTGAGCRRSTWARQTCRVPC